MVIDLAHDLYMATGYRIANANEHSDMERAMIRTWQPGKAWTLGQCMICARMVPQPERIDEGSDIYTALANAPITVCTSCAPVVDAHYAIDPKQGFVGDWEETCPRLFKQLIEGTIAPHHLDEAAYKRVVDWRPSCGYGMVLVGDSGCGKTLSLWALKRELEGIGTRCDVYTAVEIARELSKHARDLDAARHLWRTKVLCIDDLGKEPITTAAAALLWELVDRRYGEQVPTIITTRFTGTAFTDRFKEPALGADIRRRIRDACKVVTFNGGAA